MNYKRTQLHILQKTEDLSAHAASGVSLHCHTQHSKELLDFIPYYAERLPIVSYFWKKECRRYFERKGKLPNLATGYWLPPLTGQEVFQSEKDQINKVGLEALVSITDHDSITANIEINNQLSNDQAPISMEWTVPFEKAYLHVGVHNLPPARANEITEKLLNYTEQTENPNKQELHDIFTMLENIPEVLVVLNHPLWDIAMIGNAEHQIMLKAFLEEYGNWIHAFEVNGFRSWSENNDVIEMAKTLGYPLVSGGDRHCCQANTVINLTNSKSFSEFAEEIRVDKHSQIALMPEYRIPLPARQIKSISQILKDYPDFPESRQRWIDRIYVDADDDSGLRPLSFHWKKGGPKWLRWVIRTIHVLNHPAMYPVHTLTTKGKDIVPRQHAYNKSQQTKDQNRELSLISSS